MCDNVTNTLQNAISLTKGKDSNTCAEKLSETAATCTATSEVVEKDKVLECKAYRVDAMGPFESCDPRSHLHVSLQKLSLNIRPKPTLPANPVDSATYLPDADLVQCGFQLPCKHCAFVTCTWTGATQDALLTHLASSHMDL